MIHDRGVTSLHPWGKGMCNRTPANTLPEETVANAVNVDFGLGNRIAARKGMTKVYSAVGAKDSFSCPAGVFFIEGPDLKVFNTDNSATTLYTGVTGTEFAFDYLLGTVYFSDGTVSLKIVDGAALPWGLPRPGAPVVYSTAGAYDEGTYLAAVCWVDVDGVESGASAIVSADLPADTGVIFANLPQPTTGNPTYLRLYLSMPNGDALYHVADVAPGTENYTITSGRYDDGHVCESLFVSPAPGFRIIRHYGGRIYGADADGYVFHTEPFQYDRFRLSSNFLMFPDPVDIMEPVKSGIFFAYGDVTDFYAGDVEDGFDIREAATYGGVYGTGKVMTKTAEGITKVCWQSQKGTVIGTADGQVRNIVEDLIAPGTSESGAAIVREQDGIRQFIVKLNDPTTSRFAARSFIEAEIVRKGA
ncbi:MAG: hypothetical protein WC279_11825 [Sulfurimonas sp.]|jgi:hypothetical protein|uniref:hypothetical protein n=1 Tax=Sulfurimonas sp. TaxID=2022749 RepID=UPI0035657432